MFESQEAESFDKFVHYEESKLLDKIEDDLYPEYNPEIMQIIEDRKAYRKIILAAIYYEYHFKRFNYNNTGE